tara:strand:+ start:393 stop:2015 length:1623 start_codon:yes stop_codon:yes gene_type:complete
MPEPGMGSRGSRSGAGMGGGGGYAGPEIDWGMGPEGHEATEVSRSVGEDRDFDDVSPLDEKMSFMSSNPLGNPSNLFATKTPTQPVSNLSFYLDETPATVAKTDIENKKQAPRSLHSSSPIEERVTSLHTKPGPLSSWATAYETASDEEALRRMLQAHTSSTWDSWDQSTGMPRRQLSGWAYENAPSTKVTKTNEMHPLMVAGLKYGLPADEIVKVATTDNPRILGSYNPWSDVVKINPAPSSGASAAWTGTPFHEIAHRLMTQLEWDDYKKDIPNEDFLKEPLTDIQALYETGGSQIAPDHVEQYGFDPSQGEMVTSRWGTMKDLLNLNAPIHDDSSGFYMDNDWGGLARSMRRSRWGESANPITALDWQEDTAYNPNANLTDLEEFGYNRELAREYENYVRFNQELPSRYMGGDPYSDLNAPYLVDTTHKSRFSTGLEGWPMSQDHFLVNRLQARNPKLSAGYVEGLERALTNEYNAAMASPNSMLNKISRLGLADKFWDYVEEYLAEESENWSPSQAKKEIERLLGQDDKEHNHGDH